MASVDPQRAKGCESISPWSQLESHPDFTWGLLWNVRVCFRGVMIHVVHVGATPGDSRVAPFVLAMWFFKCVIDAICGPELGGSCFVCAPSSTCRRLICETRARGPLIHTHTHQCSCLTNCSPHSISENFIYSLFVVRLCYCGRAIVSRGDSSLPSSPLPPPPPVFPARRL